MADTADTTTAPLKPQHQKQQPQHKRRILLGVTGSVAAIKCPELAVRFCREQNAHVKIILTQAGEHFWHKSADYNPTAWQEFQSILALTSDDITNNNNINNTNENANRNEINQITMYRSEDEWKGWDALGDPVLHIELRDWADLMVIAPLSAHTLAKISCGLCDDLLSCVVRAWDFGNGSVRPGKPMVLAPAMNTAMWEHPLTSSQLVIVRGFWNCFNNNVRDNNDNVGVYVVEPQVKALACGEVGTGALAELDDIVRFVEGSLCR